MIKSYIVGLNIGDNRLYAELSTVEQTAFESKLQQAAEKFAKKWNITDYYKHKFIPFITTSFDESLLSDIKNSPDVTSVNENISVGLPRQPDPFFNDRLISPQPTLSKTNEIPTEYLIAGGVGFILLLILIGGKK